MRTYAVLTLIGSDAPGLVAEAAQFVVKHNGNITSNATHAMGGTVAVVSFCFTVNDDSNQTVLQAMKAALPGLAHKTKCHCDLRSAVSRSPIDCIPSHYHPDAYAVTVISDDAPGLLLAVGELCATWGVNIVVHTGEGVESAAQSGKLEYRQSFVLWLPKKCPNDAEFRLQLFAKEFAELIGRNPYCGRASAIKPAYTAFGRYW